MLWKPNKIWDGETAFIIGGGPSVNTTNLTPIHDRCVIGVNNAFFLGDWVDICWFGDLKWFRWHKKVLEREAHYRIIAHCNTRTDMVDIRWMHSMRRGKPRGIDTKASHVGWNECSGLSAINVAYHLGSKKIVLIGFDMRVVDGNKNFHTAHIEDVKPEAAEERYRHFLKRTSYIQSDANKLGVEIFNCTPGSAIKNWPIMSLDEYLKDENR